SEGVELLAQLGHGQHVGAPEVVSLAPLDRPVDLVLGALVAVEHETGSVAPPLRDGGALGAVGSDAVGEVVADAIDVGAGRLGERQLGRGCRCVSIYGRVGTGRGFNQT